MNYNHIEFGLFNTFLNGLTNVVNPNSVTRFGTLGTTVLQKWAGGVLAPNGKIYGIPSGSGTLLVIDPVARTATTSSTGSVCTGWVSGVLAPNGKIYGIPFNASTILEFIPSVTNLGVTINNKWML